MPSIVEAHSDDIPVEAALVEPEGASSIEINVMGTPLVIVTLCSEDDSQTEVFEFSRPNDLEEEDEEDVYSSLCNAETRVAVLNDKESWDTRRITRVGSIIRFEVHHEQYVTQN